MQGLPSVLVKANARIDETLCMADQLMCPCCLEPEFAQLASLRRPFKVSFHIRDFCSEVVDNPDKVTVSFKFGEVAPVPGFGCLIVQGLEAGFISIEGGAVPVGHQCKWRLVIQRRFRIWLEYVGEGVFWGTKCVGRHLSVVQESNPFGDNVAALSIGDTRYWSVTSTAGRRWKVF